jgi:vacuolar-type H+-ATPase subunit I/STV1
MAEEKKSEGLGISGFTLGVLGIIFSGWMGIIVCLVGLVFCFIQQRKHKTTLGKVGLILNIIGIILAIVIIVLYAKIAPLINQSLPSA